MTKNLLCWVSSLVLSLSTFAQVTVDTVPYNNPESGLEYLLVEKMPVTAAAIADDNKLTAKHINYRFFVDLKPNYQFLACEGYDNPIYYMRIESTEPFYNHTDFGDATGQAANPSLYAAFPSLQFDTYATDGRIGNNNVGVLKSINALGYVAITPETTPPGTLNVVKPIDLLIDNESKRLYDYNSGWICQGATPGPDTLTNIVFIGQFTTAGELQLRALIALQNPKGKIEKNYDVLYGLTEAPKIVITSPTEGDVIKVGTTSQLSAIVTDAEDIVASVEFYVNNIKVGTLANQADNNYTVNWVAESPKANTPIKVVATDTKGFISEATVKVDVTIGDPPKVSITQPVEGSIIKRDSVLKIIANAVDIDGTIDSVEFFVNDSKIGTVKKAPYQINWTASTEGNFTIKARATDNDTLSATSAAVNIVVEHVNAIKPTNSLAFDVEIYPNPVQRSLVISFNSSDQNEFYRMNIFDITGNSVLQNSFPGQAKNHKETIDLSALPSGIYILKIISSSGSSLHRRLIKN